MMGAQCKVPLSNDYLIPELTYHILWLVPVVAHAVLSTPDDGCKENPKHVERYCSEIKYRLLTAASRWKLIYIIQICICFLMVLSYALKLQQMKTMNLLHFLCFHKPWLIFFFSCFSLSCKANARVKLAKIGHVQHSSKFLICVVSLLFVLFCC
jgi:hypothetical protein